VLISLDGNKTPVHKAVLSIWSQKLASLVKTCDGTLDMKIDPAVEATFQKAITFMYQGKLEKLKREDLLALLSLASEYQVVLTSNTIY
jgi:hypothetical protein